MAPTVAGLGGPAPYWTEDAFDAVGNRTSRVSHAAAGDTTRTYTYPAAGSPGPHALTQVSATGPGGTVTSTYDYDDAGNTTGRAPAGQSAQTLTWDGEGELAGVVQSGASVGSYVYTADGERLIRREGGVTTVYLPGGQELTLTTGTGVVAATRYYSFNGSTVAVRTGSTYASVSSLVADPHGTAEVAVANTTNVVTRRRMDPYGNPRGTSPVWSGDHGFLNKPVDATGLVQVGARYYDPVIARFVSVDPVMDLTDPSQWHGYAYASNNPVTYSDPSGLITRVDDDGQRDYRPNTSHASGPPPWAPVPAAETIRTVHPPVEEHPFWRDVTPEDLANGIVQSASANDSRHADPSEPTERTWDGLLDAGRKIYQVGRFIRNASDPITSTAGAVAALMALWSPERDGGGSCGFNSGEMMVVCTGAEYGFRERGTDFGNTYVTGDEDVSADFLGHEAAHSDQWAIFGGLVFAVSYGLESLAGPCNNAFEGWAGLERGGYQC